MLLIAIPVTDRSQKYVLLYISSHIPKHCLLSRMWVILVFA